MSIPLPSSGQIHPDAAQEHAARAARESALRAAIYAESGRQRLASLVALRADVALALDSAIANMHAVFAHEVRAIWGAESRATNPWTVNTPHGPVSAAALALLARRGGALAATLATGRARLADLDEQIARARAATTDADATTGLRLVTA